MGFNTDDLWTVAEPLPGRRVLRAIAARLGAAWEAPDLAEKVTIVYNPRLRTTLGRAVLDQQRVELNVRLLRRHKSELIPLLAHELAHVLVHMRYGRVPAHGRHFRTLMRAVNMPSRATHDLPVKSLARPRRRYLYLHRCSGCGYSFVAKSVRRGYYCTACGPGMRWDIHRVPNTPQGRKALAEAMRRKRGRSSFFADDAFTAR